MLFIHIWPGYDYFSLGVLGSHTSDGKEVFDCCHFQFIEYFTDVQDIGTDILGIGCSNGTESCGGFSMLVKLNSQDGNPAKDRFAVPLCMCVNKQGHMLGKSYDPEAAVFRMSHRAALE